MEGESHAIVVEDVLGVIKVYSDGTIVRTDDPTLTVPSLRPSDEDRRVASKDVVLDANNGLWVRLYLPSQRKTHLPVIVYFHGGGFCLFSPASLLSHRFCLKWAASLGAIIVSVNYRLAPEHRLPAAYDDASAVLDWLRAQSMEKSRDGEDMDPWLNSHADFTNVYLMGDSAGGNIAHHVAMWASRHKGRQQLSIRGMILVQPFFGGEERTESEIRYSESTNLSLQATDSAWRVALPIGGNRDHHFCNPFSSTASPVLAHASPPRIVVAIGGRDLLRDRQLQYCRALMKCGKEIQVLELEEEDHGFYALKLDGESSEKLLQYVSNFINKSLV
eukprot:Gb_18570 [translate_table: standard]